MAKGLQGVRSTDPSRGPRRDPALLEVGLGVLQYLGLDRYRLGALVEIGVEVALITPGIGPVVGDPGRATTPASRHLPNLDADCKVSGVVDDGEDLTNFRGVQLAGKASEVKGAKLRDELVDLALEKYFYIGHPHLEHYLSRGMMDERRWFRLVPDRIEGWDRRLLPQPPIMERRVLPPHLRKRK